MSLPPNKKTTPFNENPQARENVISPPRPAGVTAAERYLKRLCDQSFLSLWSYSGIYRDQDSGGGRDGKEVCDLLVVFENHILIFSDKDCTFPDTGDLRLDWSRWFRRAVWRSAEQVWGAERWIRTYPYRLFVDRHCTQRFPFDLPQASDAVFHRIVVAHDVSPRCQREHGGSGSLMITPHRTGKSHYNSSAPEMLPFAVGDLDPAKDFVHVLDDTSLEVLLRTLDTVTDFVRYLSCKERFVRSGRLLSAAGEDELLAFYHKHLNKLREHDFLPPEDGSQVVLLEGHWKDFLTSPQRLAQIEANKVSYTWDRLIEKFTTHIVTNTLYATTHPGIHHQERIFRFLARESRTRRRMLARALLDCIEKTRTRNRAVRVIEPSTDGDPFYVFLILRHSPQQIYQEYRESRQALLAAYCKVVRLLRPEAKDIIGIATEAAGDENRSEDVIWYDGRDWSEEDRAEAKQLHEELGLLRMVQRFSAVEHEFPVTRHAGMGRSQRLRNTPKYPRNASCPCGSSKKYKKCCGR